MRSDGITRRTLLKLLASLPLFGPAVAQALASKGSAPKLTKPPYLPKNFPLWNHAYDGLEDPGKWLLRIERTRLPKNLTMPAPGQIWEALRQCEVPYGPRLAFPKKMKPGPGPSFYTPVTAAEFAALLECRVVKLREGDRVRIVDVDDPRPVFVNFVPITAEGQDRPTLADSPCPLPDFQCSTLQLKTVRTLGDFQPGDQIYLTEAFMLVEG